MVSTEWLEAEVLKAVPDASVEVIDLHRSGDHVCAVGRTLLISLPESYISSNAVQRGIRPVHNSR